MSQAACSDRYVSWRLRIAEVNPDRVESTIRPGPGLLREENPGPVVLCRKISLRHAYIVCYAKKFRHPACAFLRKLISPYGFGSKDAYGYRRPTNKALIDDYNRKGFIRGLTNAQMLDHFRGEATYYFWADGTDQDAARPDQHRHRQPQGRHPRRRPGVRQAPPGHVLPRPLLRALDGRQGRPRLRPDRQAGLRRRAAPRPCQMLDRSLKVVHRRWQADNPDLVVEGVEIKGHPPRINWTRDGQIKELISGQFAKLPREMLTRFDEFRQDDRPGRPADQRPLPEVQARAGRLRRAVVETGQEVGSLTGCVVKKSDLDQWDAYLDLARSLCPHPSRPRAGRSPPPRTWPSCC